MKNFAAKRTSFAAFENQKSKTFMKKVVLTFGFISGLIVVILMLSSMSLKHYKADFHLAEVIGYASMIVSLSMVFFGVRSYRDNYLNGSISFSKAFQVGILITLISACMYVAGWMIYSEITGPAMMNEYFQHSINEINTSAASATEKAAKIKEVEMWREYYKNPLIKMGLTFMEILPVGLIVTLLSAFILKRKNTSQKLATA